MRQSSPQSFGWSHRKLELIQERISQNPCGSIRANTEHVLHTCNSRAAPWDGAGKKAAEHDSNYLDQRHSMLRCQSSCETGKVICHCRRLCSDDLWLGKQQRQCKAGEYASSAPLRTLLSPRIHPIMGRVTARGFNTCSTGFFLSPKKCVFSFSTFL
jgi:hypothetical protein